MGLTERAKISSCLDASTRIVSVLILLGGAYLELSQHSDHPLKFLGEGTFGDYMGNWTLSLLPTFILKIFDLVQGDDYSNDLIPNLTILTTIVMLNAIWEALSHNPNPEAIPDTLVGALASLITLLALHRSKVRS